MEYGINMPHTEISRASVLVVGAGGLGSVLLYCLCGMGVGHITIADGDTVAAGNLDRQFLYRYADIGKNKAATARATLLALRPDASVAALTENLTDSNADALVRGKTVAVAAVDTMPARLALNAACVRQGVPLVNGGVSGQYGSMQVVLPRETACLACLYDDRQAAARSSPPAVVSAVSSLMADAVAAILSGRGRGLADAVYLFDGERMTLDRMPLQRRGACAVCGTERT